MKFYYRNFVWQSTTNLDDVASASSSSSLDDDELPESESAELLDNCRFTLDVVGRLDCFFDFCPANAVDNDDDCDDGLILSPALTLDSLFAGVFRSFTPTSSESSSESSSDEESLELSDEKILFFGLSVSFDDVGFCAGLMTSDDGFDAAAAVVAELIGIDVGLVDCGGFGRMLPVPALLL